MKYFAASLLSAALAWGTENHHAVLVAGSSGYWNYRHQADIAHAYQIMIKNGIPADNIVVMMYDDVANNRSNPFPGQLFNHPDGENVYDASAIDYSGRDVTPEKFLAVLKGDAQTAGGKVLNTDKNSKVFINFADHGAPGFVCFPSANLYADDLQDTIDYMQANNLYDEMTIYIEACESGSMFDLIKPEQKIYAVTASNADKSSYAAYCGTDAVVDGHMIGSCLSDLFTQNWILDVIENEGITAKIPASSSCWLCAVMPAFHS